MLHIRAHVCAATVVSLVMLMSCVQLASASTNSQTRAAAHNVPDSKYRKVFVFSGTSSARTRAFAIRVGNQWLLQWSFNCSGITAPAFVTVGYKGAHPDGDISIARNRRIKAFGRVRVQETGPFHFRVSSNCTWRIAVYKRPTPPAPKTPSATTGVNPFTGAAMTAYLASRTDDVTAAVYDIVTKQTYVYRPGSTQQTASIIKVDILATLLAQHQGHNPLLNEDDAELATGMIESSDNDDATDLWNEIGASTAVAKFNAVCGLTHTAPNTAGFWGNTTTTAMDQIQLLKNVALENSNLDTAARSYELNLMENVIPFDRWGVSAGPTGTTVVALKNGWLPLTDTNWQVNSIGYINGAGRQYLIAVLTTNNPAENYGIQTIEEMSRLIWNQLAPTATGN